MTAEAPPIVWPTASRRRFLFLFSHHSTLNKVLLLTHLSSSRVLLFSKHRHLHRCHIAKWHSWFIANLVTSLSPCTDFSNYSSSHKTRNREVHCSQQRSNIPQTTFRICYRLHVMMPLCRTDVASSWALILVCTVHLIQLPFRWQTWRDSGGVHMQRCDE